MKTWLNKAFSEKGNKDSINLKKDILELKTKISLNDKLDQEVKNSLLKELISVESRYAKSLEKSVYSTKLELEILLETIKELQWYYKTIHDSSFDILSFSLKMKESRHLTINALNKEINNIINEINSELSDIDSTENIFLDKLFEKQIAEKFYAYQFLIYFKTLYDNHQS